MSRPAQVGLPYVAIILAAAAFVLLIGQHAEFQKTSMNAPASSSPQPLRTPTSSRNKNGALVQRIALRKPIETPSGEITLVIKVTNVPGAPHSVFYLPCDASGACQAQRIPGQRRSVVGPTGDVIAVSNASPDTARMRLWTPPPDEHI